MQQLITANDNLQHSNLQLEAKNSKLQLQVQNLTANMQKAVEKARLKIKSQLTAAAEAATRAAVLHAHVKESASVIKDEALSAASLLFEPQPTRQDSAEGAAAPPSAEQDAAPPAADNAADNATDNAAAPPASLGPAAEMPHASHTNQFTHKSVDGKNVPPHASKGALQKPRTQREKAACCNDENK